MSDRPLVFKNMESYHQWVYFTELFRKILLHKHQLCIYLLLMRNLHFSTIEILRQADQRSKRGKTFHHMRREEKNKMQESQRLMCNGIYG